MQPTVDLNIVRNGETALPLHKLLQEIEILLSARHQTVITNYDEFYDADKFLFKNGINGKTVAKTIQENINRNCHVPAGFNVNVSCEFLNNAGARDILLINVNVITPEGHVEQLMYSLR